MEPASEKPASSTSNEVHSENAASQDGPPEQQTLHSSNDDTPSKKPPQFRLRTLVLISIMFVFLLFAYDNTVVANLRPRMVASLSHIEKLPLLSTAYSLGSLCMHLLW
jgi:hypothetical protein